MECQNRSDKYIWSPHDAYFYKGLSELIVDIDRLIYLSLEKRFRVYQSQYGFFI